MQNYPMWMTIACTPSPALLPSQAHTPQDRFMQSHVPCWGDERLSQEQTAVDVCVLGTQGGTSLAREHHATGVLMVGAVHSTGGTPGKHRLFLREKTLACGNAGRQGA